MKLIKKNVTLIDFDDIPELDLPKKNSFLDITNLLKDLQKFFVPFYSPKICTWMPRQHKKLSV